MSTIDNLALFTSGDMLATRSADIWQTARPDPVCPICGKKLYEVLGRRLGMCIHRGCRFNFR